MTKGKRKGWPAKARIPAGTREGNQPVGGQADLHAEGTKSPEHLRRERLVAMLRDVDEDRGKVKAAEALSVSFRTLGRAVESGRLAGRMAEALGATPAGGRSLGYGARETEAGG